MGRKSLKERNIRKLARVGGGKTYSVTIPIEMIRELKWKKGEKKVIKLEGEKIVIEDWVR